MESSKDTIAFIGLGVMGYHMAVNLRNKIGREKHMVICDVNGSACQKFMSETANAGPSRIVKTAKEAIEAADTLITVLPSSEAMQAVYLDAETGVIAGAKTSTSNKLAIECGTIASNTVMQVFEASKQIPNLEFIDAPISGGPMGSKAGTLSFMVGCPEPKFPSLKALFTHMGSPSGIFHCGEVGSGTAFKIINNYISIISVLSVSEAYNIASRLNLDLDKLTDLFNSGSAQCWVTSKNNPVPGIHPDAPASHGYEGGFRIELAHKVLELGKELAEMAGARTSLDKAALGVFKEAAGDERYAGKDARVVYKFLTDNGLDAVRKEES